MTRKIRNGRYLRLSIYVNLIIVKSTTPSMLLHCDVINNIHHLQIKMESSIIFKVLYFPRCLGFCLKFCMGDLHDLINEIYNEKKYSSTIATFSRHSVFVTVSFIILFEFLFDVLYPWLEVWNGPPEAYVFFHFIKGISKLCSVGTFSK